MVKTILGNRFIPQHPTPKQLEFLLYDDEEARYGGAVGGGKSSALLMAALQYVQEPNYAALLLRRTYADLSLPDALMPRAEEWLGGMAHWHDNTKTWTFPSGATLTFGYLETERDRAWEALGGRQRKTPENDQPGKKTRQAYEMADGN